MIHNNKVLTATCQAFVTNPDHIYGASQLHMFETAPVLPNNNSLYFDYHFILRKMWCCVHKLKSNLFPNLECETVSGLKKGDQDICTIWLIW